jgi:hypothetical protein
MPNAHKHPATIIRPPGELKSRAKDAVAALGTDLNAWVIASLEYLVGDRDEPPVRPARRIPPAD